MCVSVYVCSCGCIKVDTKNYKKRFLNHINIIFRY